MCHIGNIGMNTFSNLSDIGNISDISDVSNVLTGSEEDLTHLNSLAGSESYWNYLDEIDYHLERDLEVDCPEDAEG